MIREGIAQNFEKIELLLISDYLLYNLIFSKENLNLDDYKTAIFINLMWLLLKNDNNAYRPSGNKFGNQISQKVKEDLNKIPKTLESDV